MTYLEYCIDSEGLHPTDDKLRAVQAAPVPRNVTELKSYLGLLTYYGRFLPYLPSTLAPLYSLLHQDVEWQWNSKKQEAFKRSKELLLSSKVLVHFDPKLPVVLACDASSYSIGAVLATSCQTVLRSQLVLFQEHYLQQKNNTHRLKKKVYHVCLMYEDFMLI